MESFCRRGALGVQCLADTLQDLFRGASSIWHDRHYSVAGTSAFKEAADMGNVFRVLLRCILDHDPLEGWICKAAWYT